MISIKINTVNMRITAIEVKTLKLLLVIMTKAMKTTKTMIMIKVIRLIYLIRKFKQVARTKWEVDEEEKYTSRMQIIYI